MGDVIRGSAKADDIFADLRTSYKNGLARGTILKEIVGAQLGPMIAAVNAFEAEFEEARNIAEPHMTALKAANDRAGAELARLHDEVWNEVGRPAGDVALSFLFFQASAHCDDGELGQKVLRLELLARLFDRGLHPKLTAERSEAFAQRVRDVAKELKAATHASRLPVARVKLLSGIRTEMGGAAQAELARLKRELNNAGYTEPEIHTIIPDRPPPAKKAAEAKLESDSRSRYGVIDT